MLYIQWMIHFSMLNFIFFKSSLNKKEKYQKIKCQMISWYDQKNKNKKFNEELISGFRFKTFQKQEFLPLIGVCFLKLWAILEIYID